MNVERNWRVVNHLASLDGAAPVGQLDLNRPDIGLSLRWGEVSLGTCFGQVGAIATEPTVVYVRGNDLVVAYPPTDEAPFDREVYWRLIAADDEWISLEFIYSLRTGLLDTHPAPTLECHLTASDSRLASVRTDDDEALIKAARNGQQKSNFCFVSAPALRAEMAVGVFPCDLGELAVESAAKEQRVQLGLASEFLEKGVIRRWRAFFAVGVGARADAEELEQAAQNFVESTLPLTT